MPTTGETEKRRSLHIPRNELSMPSSSAQRNHKSERAALSFMRNKYFIEEKVGSEAKPKYFSQHTHYARHKLFSEKVLGTTLDMLGGTTNDLSEVSSGLEKLLVLLQHASLLVSLRATLGKRCEFPETQKAFPFLSFLKYFLPRKSTRKF